MISRSTLALVALVALCHHVHAFVPGAGRTHRVAARPLFLPSPTSSSRLSVGVSLEDFMTGKDEEKRKKENERYIQELQKRVEKINALEPMVDDMSDEELQAKTVEFKERLAKGEDINGPLVEEAFAVVREAAWCVLYCSCC